LVVALPKELTSEQRIELAEQFIQEFADRYQYPYSCAIHHHVGSLGGQEQPHLHLIYSERHVDGIERTPEQFLSVITLNSQRKGRSEINSRCIRDGQSTIAVVPTKTEELINDSLQRYAPTKVLEIRGLKVEVPNEVSCLSNEDYNKKYDTNLQDVPMMNKALRFAKKVIQFAISKNRT
jgi:hypothetical protein